MEKEQLLTFLDNNKERWALGLTYMADEKLDDQYKTAEAHLSVILNEIRNYLK